MLWAIGHNILTVREIIIVNEYHALPIYLNNCIYVLIATIEIQIYNLVI